MGAVTALLLSQSAAAQHRPSEEARAALHEAVQGYQVFVVPICAPDEVRAYVGARADRDRRFVRSLRDTILAADYKKAVADRAAQDSRTVYECFGPPPPPPPPQGAAPAPAIPTQTEPRQPDSRAEHFAEGDRQFEKMVRRRDAAIGRPGR
jgi:hypothetical protein